MATPTRKRSKLFVDRRVQGALMRQLCLHWLTAGALALLYLLIMQMFVNGAQVPLQEHAAAIWTQYGALIVTLCVILPAFLYDSLRLSNRFAGPMISFRRALDSLARGEKIDRLTFRGNDYWREMGDNLNQVAARLGSVTSERLKVEEES